MSNDLSIGDANTTKAYDDVINCGFNIGESEHLTLKNARYHFERASNDGHPLAVCDYAIMCLFGHGGDLEIDEGKYFLKLADARLKKEAPDFNPISLCTND